MGKPFTPFSQSELIPQEETLEITPKQGNQLSIGIPKEESDLQEKRVLLTPDAVSVLTLNGHKVILEKGAGLGAHYTDYKYSEAGAEITSDRKKVFSQQIIGKIIPPKIEDISLMKPNSLLVSQMLAGTQKKTYFETLMKKRVTAVASELIQNEYGEFPVEKLLSEIEGTSAILIASHLLFTSNNGNGLLLGGITGIRPTEIVIIGANTAGEYAAKSALGLGASVRIFDSSIHRLREVQNKIGQRISTSIVHPKELKKALMRADVAIGTLNEQGRTPTIVTEEMVKAMKPGAVIIDLSISNGGCFETSELTTHEKPTFIKHEIIHYGVANITSNVARSSTKALSNFFLQKLLSISRQGGLIQALRSSKGFKNSIYTHRGCLTNQHIGEWFNIPYSQIKL